MEQLAAFLAGEVLHLFRQRAPRLRRPVELFGDTGRILRQQPLLVAELGRLDLAVEHREPVREVGQSLEVRPEQQPVLLGRIRREALGDSGKIKLVEQPGVDQLDLARVEVRRGAAEGGEIEILGELRERRGRLDGSRGADPRENRQQSRTAPAA